MTWRAAATLLVLGLAVGPAPAYGHAFGPTYLEVVQTAPGRWQAELRQPRVDGEAALRPRWDDACRAEPSRVVGQADERRVIRAWRLTCTGPLRQVAIDGFRGDAEEVLLRVSTSSVAGDELYRLTPSDPAIERGPSSSAEPTIPAFFALGLQHILEGYDHLAFVGLVVLLVGSWRAAVAALSMFTVAHSVTLATTALGWVVVPSAPAEAVIALSIVFTAREVLRPPEGGPSGRRTIGLSLVFGLLHGMGLAGVLMKVGLPEGYRLPALLGFNVGVEVGQLAFAFVVAIVGSALPQGAGRLVRTVLAYAVGGLAAYWSMARLLEIING